MPSDNPNYTFMDFESPHIGSASARSSRSNSVSQNFNRAYYAPSTDREDDSQRDSQFFWSITDSDQSPRHQTSSTPEDRDSFVIDKDFYHVLTQAFKLEDVLSQSRSWNTTQHSSRTTHLHNAPSPTRDISDLGETSRSNFKFPALTSEAHLSGTALLGPTRKPYHKRSNTFQPFPDRAFIPALNVSASESNKSLQLASRRKTKPELVVLNRLRSDSSDSASACDTIHQGFLDSPSIRSSISIDEILPSPSPALSRMQAIQKTVEVTAPSRFRRFGQACASAFASPDLEYDAGSECSNRTIDSRNSSAMKNFRFWPSHTSAAGNPISSRPQTAMSISTSLSPTAYAFDHRLANSTYTSRAPPVLRRSNSSSHLSSTPGTPWKAPNIYGRTSGISRSASVPSSEADMTPDYTTHGQAVFAEFYASTKPRSSSQDITTRMLKQQRKEAEFAQQMAQGAYFNLDEANEDEVSEGGSSDVVAVDSASQQRGVFLALEDDCFEDDGRWELDLTPPNFGNSRESSISEASTLGRSTTPPTPSLPNMPNSYRLAQTDFSLILDQEKKRKSGRRRTASSECIMEEAANGLRTMMLGSDFGDDELNEFAVEDDGDEDIVDTRLTFLSDSTGFRHARFAPTASGRWSN